jgi:hypothetical protein
MNYDTKAHRKGDKSSRACLKATNNWHRANARLDRLWLQLDQFNINSFLRPFLDELEEFGKTPSICDHTGREMKLAEKALGHASVRLHKNWRSFLELTEKIIVATREVDAAGLTFDEATENCSVCIAEEEEEEQMEIERSERIRQDAASRLPRPPQGPLRCNFCGRKHIPLSEESRICLNAFWRLHVKNGGKDPTKKAVRKEIDSKGKS